MFTLIGTLIIGFIVGLLGRWLHPGDDKMGIILTTVLGVAGAFLATYAGQAMHLYEPGQSAGFIGAVIGAVVLLLVVGVIRKAVK
ncbi:GlsB/YeaQ/YmgE family stress response membrane protein [Nevskia soli]|uniref:GlsB/YeaQ/YmgE family stress response membrane protein n=1 Tax=Nevskia soli TaxID=418856 RepID=UPI0004A6D030|nr:GlsB/YeaQ/YmgE family stress response membrane protein [Nevskia soli]